jgi:hypothetical protein
MTWSPTHWTHSHLDTEPQNRLPSQLRSIFAFPSQGPGSFEAGVAAEVGAIAKFWKSRGWTLTSSVSKRCRCATISMPERKTVESARALVWQWLKFSQTQRSQTSQALRATRRLCLFSYKHSTPLPSAISPCLPSDVDNNDARNEYRESDGFDRPVPHFRLVLETWAERDMSLSTAEMPWDTTRNRTKTN